MKLPNFLKRFWSKEKVDKNMKSENIVNQTAQEIWNIIRDWNIQWENFNKVVDYIEKIIFWVFENDVKLLSLQQVYHEKQLSLALAFPFFISPEDLEKEDPEIIEMYNKNQVTRVSTDSLRRYFILKSLDKLLKISSVKDFWDCNYKIWDIEINQFEDLEKIEKNYKICMKNGKTMIFHDIKKRWNMQHRMELTLISIAKKDYFWA